MQIVFFCIKTHVNKKNKLMILILYIQRKYQIKPELLKTGTIYKIKYIIFYIYDQTT